MSRTFRHIPADKHLAELKGWESPPTFIQQMPDGYCLDHDILSNVELC